jgi:hypothetical protein
LHRAKIGAQSDEKPSVIDPIAADVAAASAFAQETRLGSSCDLSVIGATGTNSLLAFDRELRLALTKQDAVAMALLVEFPLRTNADGGSYSLNDPVALETRLEAFG